MSENKGLSREEILAMPAGRELDALVAEKVMGLDIVSNGLKYEPRYYLPEYERTYHRAVPVYSTDISAAWEVAEKFGEMSVRKYQTMSLGYRWVCRIYVNEEDVIANGLTAPEAICKSALIAVNERRR